MTGGKKGFSVVEMLVVVAVFSVASLVIASTHVNFTRLHRRTANAELLGEDMRFVTELLVRLARNNTVDYPTVPTALPSPSSTLALDTPSGGTVKVRRFSASNGTCAGLNAACLGLSLNGGAYSAITGKNIDINRFDVYLTPTISPFEATGVGTYNNNNQPRVTFLIEAGYNASSTLERATSTVQTSVSSRLYLR